MKIMRLIATWTVGAAGLLFAGGQLLQAAELSETNALAQSFGVVPPIDSGATLTNLSAEEKVQYRDQIERLRAQYGDQTLNRLVLEARDGKLRITGFKLETNSISGQDDSREDGGAGGGTGPSCT